jgi:hypothetical protein
MSDKNATAVPAGPVQTENDASRTKESGRAVFDSGGRSSWEWKTETGNFSREISTKRLKLLEASDLTLEKTALLKKVALQEGKTSPSGGFNPYDRGVQGSARSDVTRAPATPPRPKPFTLAPRRPTTVLGRLRALFAKK